ncbi:MAG: ATP-binding cassette domain-containing protein [Myxococcus sp.]|nr:ATP-binding cassette domain-containing protein [Myxococcus sp.]
MSTSSSGTATPHVAGDTLVHGLEQVARALNHEFDPVRAREEARGSLGALTTFGPGELLEAFRLSAQSLRVACTPVSRSAAELVHAPPIFPLVTITAAAEGPCFVILSERHGARLRAQVGVRPAAWLDEAELTALVGPAAVTYLHCVPAAPMERLSAASHSAQAVLGGEDGEDTHHAHLRPWDRVWALLALERDDLWVVVIYSAAVGVLSLATPVAVQSLVTSVAFGTLLQPIVVLAVLFLIALGFQAALKALQVRVMETLKARLFARVAIDVAWRLPRAIKDDHPVTPELVNRFFDVVTLQKTMATVLTDGLAAVMQISIGLLVLAFYHPALLALDIVLVIATTLFVLIPLRRGVRTAFDESKAKYEVAAWLEELARAPSAFRGTGGAALASARADALTRKYLVARERHFRVVLGQTISALTVQVVASAVLLGFGGYLVINEALTLGQLIAAELIVAAVTSSITKFGKILDSTYDFVIGLTKVGHLIDLDVQSSLTGEKLPGAGPVGVTMHDLDVEGVTLNATIAPGARVAIVGAQGGPLSELLSGVRQPASGSVEVGGVDVRRASTCALHDDVLLVRPDDLFLGTVFENVSLTRPSVTPDDVRSAVERVGLTDDLRALPEGYDTELGPEGPALTPSQKLRLVVARALAATPRLIIVDDTLEGLDPVVRARTVAALTRKDAPWTLIALVSDRTSALARACGQVMELSGLTTAPTPPPGEEQHA